MKAVWIVGITVLMVGACAPDRPARVEHRDPVPETTRVPRPPRLSPPMAVAVSPDAEPVPATQIYRGTGQFIHSQVVATRSAFVAGDGEVTLNFVNVDVKDVVRAVVGELLHANVVIDPGLQGTVNIQTARPLPREAVLPALEVAMRLAGAALIRVNGGYRAVPLRDAPQQGIIVQPTGRFAAGPGYGVQIVPLRYVGADEMQRILEPLAPQGSILRVDQHRNLLVLAGSAPDLAVMRDNIATFDVDWLAGMSFAIFPVRSARAKAVVGDLTQILGEGSPIGSSVRLVPIDRMNAIVAVSSRAAYLEEIERWIERLDQGTNTAEQRIYVYYVQNGRAVDIAAVLAKVLLGDREPRRPGEVSAEPGRVADGYDAMRRTIPAGPPQRPPPVPMEPPDRRPGDAQTPDSGIQFGSMSTVQITADEKNNALVILATPREFMAIEAALKKLDVIPLQVMIEAAVAEVTLTDELRYGVQYFIKQGSSRVVLSNARTGDVAPQFPGFSYIFSSGADIRVVLNLLEDVTNVSVISSPNLMVLNNQTATLQVGDQVPIATQSAVSVLTPGAPIVNTIQFRDTGVILKVTPRVNESGLVLIDVAQEVSDVAATTTSGIDSPTIQQRKVSSTVIIQDGETLALGGLIRDGRTTDTSGIPGLQGIPIIGSLFGTKTNSLKRTELLVLITPRVVRNTVEAREITDELRRRMKATAPLFERAW